MVLIIVLLDMGVLDMTPLLEVPHITPFIHPAPM